MHLNLSEIVVDRGNQVWTVNMFIIFSLNAQLSHLSTLYPVNDCWPFFSILSFVVYRDNNFRWVVLAVIKSAGWLWLQCNQSGFTSLINVAADSGNTPLHAAVNRGDVAVVRELLSSSDINVNAVNHECGDATPLLLAAMHGLLCYNCCKYVLHSDIIYLLQAAVNWSCEYGSKNIYVFLLE